MCMKLIRVFCRIIKFQNKMKIVRGINFYEVNDVMDA